jgi:hypothetical protein
LASRYQNRVTGYGENVEPSASAAEKLATLSDAAETALDTAKNETIRTPGAIARRKEVFNALIAERRDVKKHHFLETPLTDADIESLGLKTGGPRQAGFETGSIDKFFKTAYYNNSNDCTNEWIVLWIKW